MFHSMNTVPSLLFSGIEGNSCEILHPVIGYFSEVHYPLKVQTFSIHIPGVKLGRI